MCISWLCDVSATCRCVWCAAAAVGSPACCVHFFPLLGADAGVVVCVGGYVCARALPSGPHLLVDCGCVCGLYVRQLRLADGCNSTLETLVTAATAGRLLCWHLRVSCARSSVASLSGDELQSLRCLFPLCVVLAALLQVFQHVADETQRLTVSSVDQLPPAGCFFVSLV